jgi:hypothetical protein
MMLNDAKHNSLIRKETRFFKAVLFHLNFIAFLPSLNYRSLTLGHSFPLFGKTVFQISLETQEKLFELTLSFVVGHREEIVVGVFVHYDS